MPFHKKTARRIKEFGAALQFNNFTGFVKSNPILSGVIGSGLLATIGALGVRAIRRRKKSKSVRRRKTKKRTTTIRRRSTKMSRRMAKVRRHRKGVSHRSPRHKGHKRVSFVTAKGQRVSFLSKKGGRR